MDIIVPNGVTLSNMDTTGSTLKEMDVKDEEVPPVTSIQEITYRLCLERETRTGLQESAVCSLQPLCLPLRGEFYPGRFGVQL